MKFDINHCIEQCINGRGSTRKHAWDLFVQHTAGLVYASVQRTLRRWPRHQHEVEDRVQDVYVKLLADDCRLLKTFDPSRASLSTWLTLVARSTTRDGVQKRRIEALSLAEHDSPPAADSRQFSGVISEAVSLDSLTERQREVLQMIFDQNMSVEEIAARLNVDAQTVRSTKHKALIRLREQLANEEPS